MNRLDKIDSDYAWKLQSYIGMDVKKPYTVNDRIKVFNAERNSRINPVSGRASTISMEWNSSRKVNQMERERKYYSGCDDWWLISIGKAHLVHFY